MINELSHYTLAQAVDRFADQDLLNEQYSPFNRDLVNIFEGELARISTLQPDLIETEAWKIAISNLKLPPEVVLMRAAIDVMESIHSVALIERSREYYAATKNKAEEVTIIIFDQVLKEYGISALIPMIFPPRNETSSTDFGIHPEFRLRLLKILLSRMKSLDDLSEVFTEYLDDNPYFRIYPIRRQL